jgi:hypothetical protein
MLAILVVGFQNANLIPNLPRCTVLRFFRRDTFVTPSLSQWLTANLTLNLLGTIHYNYSILHFRSVACCKPRTQSARKAFL